MNFSLREKTLVVASLLLVFFLIYWYWLLNPLMRSNDRLKTDLVAVRMQLQPLKPAASAAPSNPANVIKIKLFPRDEQISRIINFIDQNFSWFGIELVSLQQSSADNRLNINLKFRSSYYQLLGFINSFPKLDTILVIDRVTVGQDQGRLVTEMNLISGYQ